VEGQRLDNLINYNLNYIDNESYVSIITNYNKVRIKQEPLLQKIKIGEIKEVPVYLYPQINFKTFPDRSLGRKLNSVLHSRTKIGVFLKLARIAGGTSSLWTLLLKGITTGLSGGTIDIIYRVGVPSKVNGLLDNLDIAIGCLQRRYQISNILAEIIKNNNINNIVSIAGGSCLIPIEAIYQSGQNNLHIINIDYSLKANEKSKDLVNYCKQLSDKDIIINTINSDIRDNNILHSFANLNSRIFECTGLWEYLDDPSRNNLLHNIFNVLEKLDYFILTELTHNPQVELFERMGFKKLNPQNPFDFIIQINKHGLKVKEVYLTPNKTYATAVISKY